MNDPNREKVWKLFRGRCLKCYQKGACVHEIIPRSQLGEDALEISNRCVLCNGCHLWAHMIGSTVSIPLLQTMRTKYMEKMN